MAVITIARELASLGEEIARELCAITGYKLVDKEYLEKRLGEFGLGPEKRERYDEKKPGFWASLSQERDDYLHYLKTAVFEEAADGNCIVVGRGGSLIFRGLPSLISIKLSAPVSVRVQRVMKQYGCDERHALQIVEQSDHDRSGFHKYFFGQDWADPREYDLTICTARMTPRAVAEQIDMARRLLVDSATEEAGRTRVAELLLGQRVVTEVVYAKRVPIHFLEANVEGGRVVLHGVANTPAAIDSALAAARSVSGVAEVESAIQVVQEFTVMP
jgi:cytidylate kinase